MSRRRIAFVLTGGGSLGAIQVGMVSALHGHGIDPDVLIGTSVGAVNAAYLAGPGTTAARLTALATLWSGTRRRDLFTIQPPRWVRAMRGREPSVFSAEPLRHLLRLHLGYPAFEDARLQLHVTATDLVTGRGLILSSGPVLEAVQASAAVPGLLPPVPLGGRMFVDGAIGHPETLAHADHCDVDEIYLLPAGYPCAGAPPRTALGTALTSVSVLLHRQLIEQVHAYSGRARLHVVPPLCPLAISPADFTRLGSLMRRARVSTEHWLDNEPEAGLHSPGDVLAFHAEHRPHVADDGRAPAPLGQRHVNG